SQHYKDFLELYGQNTNEQFHLSYSKVLSNEQNSDLNTGRFVNNLIQMDLLTIHLENISYSCGSPIFYEEHTLANRIYIDHNLTCDLPIERNYYSCRLKDVDLCYWCGTEDGLLEIPIDFFKNIYPLCYSCQENGYKWSTCAPKLYDNKSL
ncbi:11636_t:CDS:2, partial [Dentiscutata heterogama]